MQRALIICLALATSIVSPRARAETPAKPRQRLILCDDGGSLGAPNMEAPIGIEGLVRAAIDPLRDTMIDTLYWQIGTDPYFGTPTHRLTEWYSHDTKVGPRWGEDRQTFATAGEWRIYENARQIMEQGIDPVEVVIRHGHEAGLDVFVSLRFNDHHDAGLPKGLDDPNMSPLKREHPDWLIGGKGYYRKSLNFAVPEVRAYSLALMKETIENYDLDGLDIDFCRWPVLFREGEAANGATHVTGIVRRVRGMLDDKARKAGRRLHLSVRVPGSLANAGKAGIDVGTWIRDGLVDLVTVGDTIGWNYRLPIEEYVSAAKDTGCRVIAQNLCAFKEPRPKSAGVLFGEPSYYTTAQSRAVAATHWQAGADGMLLWNHHWIRFVSDERYDRQPWKEIGDPQAISRKDKHYLVMPASRGGPVPATLSPGKRVAFKQEIADDLDAARRDGAVGRAVLRLLVEQLTARDVLECRLNGRLLDFQGAVRHLNYNDCWLDLDATAALRQGFNDVEITVLSRNPHVTSPLVLRAAEALVTYADAAR
jgi:hypothetical protein